jgi:hypothetical protein
MAKLVLTSPKIVPLPEAVSISLFAKLIDAAGVFDGWAQEAPKTMLEELARLDTGARAAPEVSEPQSPGVERVALSARRAGASEVT